MHSSKSSILKVRIPPVSLSDGASALALTCRQILSAVATEVVALKNLFLNYFFSNGGDKPNLPNRSLPVSGRQRHLIG